MHSGDNETISTRIENIPKKKTEPVYYDLEVSRKEAIEWVKGNAKNYKGYSDAQRAKNLGK